MKRTICNFASSLNSSRSSSLASIVAHEQQQYTKNLMSYSTTTGTSGLTNILTKKHVGKYPQEYLESFEVYNKLNAKFRVAVVNTCNMNCFFCHNEGMENPRSLGDKTPIKKQGKEPFPVKELVRMMNDFCDLGGTQLNITGGEPLVRKDIVEVLNSIDKQNTRVVLNSNILLAERLLREPKVPQVDAIYASLHTTRESDFKKYLGINAGAEQVMKNMVLLKEHGYRVQINYSLGDYNKDEFENVLKFALPNKIDLKVISLIRSNLDKSQYCNPDEEKSWTNPKWLEDLMERNGVQVCGTREGFGGRVKIYKTNESSDHRVEIKNIGRGRLMTDYCNGCRFADKCGEGIYAVRSGVDGLWKPCVLNSDKFSTMKIEDPSDDYKMQILSVVHNMVGEWKNHQFVEGSPQ